MRENFARGAVAGVFQLGGPEQGVEIENVLADEVVKLGTGVTREELIEIESFLVAKILERAHVADRGIEPDIEILAWGIGDFKTEVGGVARNVPVRELVFADFTQPFLHFVGGFRL